MSIATEPKKAIKVTTAFFTLGLIPLFKIQGCCSNPNAQAPSLTVHGYLPVSKPSFWALPFVVNEFELQLPSSLFLILPFSPSTVPVHESSVLQNIVLYAFLSNDSVDN